LLIAARQRANACVSSLHVVAAVRNKLFREGERKDKGKIGINGIDDGLVGGGLQKGEGIVLHLPRAWLLDETPMRTRLPPALHHRLPRSEGRVHSLQKNQLK
jgi:hypothetical protein